MCTYLQAAGMMCSLQTSKHSSCCTLIMRASAIPLNFAAHLLYSLRASREPLTVFSTREGAHAKFQGLGVT